MRQAIFNRVMALEGKLSPTDNQIWRVLWQMERPSQDEIDALLGSEPGQAATAVQKRIERHGDGLMAVLTQRYPKWQQSQAAKADNSIHVTLNWGDE